MAIAKEVIGEKYGHLEIISDAYYVPDTPRKVNVVCVCGEKKTVRLSDLRAGYTKSCGCKSAEMQGKTHGSTKTPLYRVWINMRSRCYNPKHKFYDSYGGRGISIDSEWEDFQTFKDWSYANGYSENLSIDRKNNDKGYSPSNCRWVNQQIQTSNRRSVKNSSSKYVGVSYNPKCTLNPWLASIKHKGKNIRIGIYPTELQAARARDNYVIKNKLPNTINL